MLSVVVCTYNRCTSLATTLTSLRRMTIPSEPWELIVVDNNSTDNTRRVVETSDGNVQYVFEPRQGASFARNAGVTASSGEIIAFIDDDALPAPDWLAAIAETFEQFDCIGLGGKCIPLWNEIAKPDWLTTEGPYRLMTGFIPAIDLGDEVKQGHAPSGMNMAFRRSAFEQYGLFRTDLGPQGTSRGCAEDTEFGRRLIKGGESVIYSPRIIVFHPVNPARITKKYVLSWYFHMGKAQIRESAAQKP